MDILITSVIAGFAVSFVVETLTDLTSSFLSGRLVRHLLTAPLAFLAVWQFGIIDASVIVAASAAGFFSLAISRLVNRAATITQVVNNSRR